MPELIQAKPIFTRHAFEDSFAVDGGWVRKISLAEHRGNAALQPVAHGHRQRCCRTKHGCGAPSSGQTKAATGGLNHNVAHLSPKLKMGVAENRPSSITPSLHLCRASSDSPFLVPGQSIVFLGQNRNTSIVFSNNRNPYSLLQFRNQRVAFQPIQLSRQCHNSSLGLNTAWQSQTNGMRLRVCLSRYSLYFSDQRLQKYLWPQVGTRGCNTLRQELPLSRHASTLQASAADVKSNSVRSHYRVWASSAE